jgi:hypothetical protein
MIFSGGWWWLEAVGGIGLLLLEQGLEGISSLAASSVALRQKSGVEKIQLGPT